MIRSNLLKIFLQVQKFIGLEHWHFWRLLSCTWIKVQNFKKKFNRKCVTFQEETVSVNCYSSDWYFEAIDNRNSVWFENGCHRPNDRMPTLAFFSLDDSIKVPSSLMHDSFWSLKSAKLSKIIHNLFLVLDFIFFRLVDFTSSSKF